tara:strand:+ start:1986 stop:2369 length:384 start_codon:yes stop_codon:yes gene_type:complete
MRIIFLTILVLSLLSFKPFNKIVLNEHKSMFSLEITKEVCFSDKIVDVIAGDICKQLNELGDIRLTDEIVDPLFIKTLYKYEKRIYEEYDFNSHEQKIQLSKDLMNKLMKDCEKYKLYALQKLEEFN